MFPRRPWVTESGQRLLNRYPSLGFRSPLDRIEDLLAFDGVRERREIILLAVEAAQKFVDLVDERCS